MGLLNPGGPIAQSKRNRCSIPPVEVIFRNGVRKKMLKDVEVRLNTDFSDFIKKNPGIAKIIVYTGCIDEYFGYRLGHLNYRSVRFETEELDMEDFQGNAVVNYTSWEQPYTRIIEHKHFEFGKQPTTVISREYSAERKPGMEPYYPINDAENSALYEEYKKLADIESNVIFGGRFMTWTKSSGLHWMI